MILELLLSGNEAIARGAYESGVKVVSGYPGTPSTEIIENAIKYANIYSQWSPNEKVALEVGIGVSLAGGRALITMKHVGVNVAADPLLTLTYTGVNGGVVLISADDPGMHSSQNEQDNRFYGLLGKLPVLEPSDSQEAKDFVKKAFEISEIFDTPVIVRITTRIAHSKSKVKLTEPLKVSLKEYDKNIPKYVMVPGNARVRHEQVEKRRKSLEEFAEKTELNILEMRDKKIGIITAGISYQYVREVLPEASILKIGLAWPLPKKLIKEFASQVERLVVVEELEPIFETQVKALGLKVEGKNILPRQGEFSPDILRQAFFSTEIKENCNSSENLPTRPPVLCPGCPHRGVFYVLNKLKLNVMGDIGCYALGAMPPLSSMDTCICMGSSIGSLLGMEKARGEDFMEECVAVIGDSTFFHSGITGLVDVVYNGGNSTIIILDNSTTAMTGHQDHPGTGLDAYGRQARQIDLKKLVESVGVSRVWETDPYNLEGLSNLIKREIKEKEPSVIITKAPCRLISKEARDPLVIDSEKCTGCKLCQQIGCPSIEFLDNKAKINEITCVGCGLCTQVCLRNAIGKSGEIHD